MNDKQLEGTIIRAVAGDEDAIAEIFEQYAPMINNCSLYDGRINEDIRQHILFRLYGAILKFEA